MKNELLAEIKELCKKAIRKTDDKILDEEVIDLEKKAFVSIGGCFDSIIILVEELEKGINDESNR